MLLRFGAALVGYALLLAFAIHQQWRGHDFVWAFWVTGIAVTAYGTALIPFLQLPAKLREARDQDHIPMVHALLVLKLPADAAAKALVFAAFITCAFCPWLFGPIGLMLNGFVPLVERTEIARGGGIFIDIVSIGLETFGSYWPVALIACLARTPWLVRGLRGIPGNGGGILPGAAGLLLLYEALFAGAVVVAAMLVEVAIGGLSRQAANVGGYVLMAVILFPWLALADLARRKPVT